jgi:hypothetical protein
MPELGTAIGWASLAIGLGCALVGLALVWSQRNAKVPLPPPDKVGEEGAIGEVIKATTDFAKALKDLDRGIQLITLGALFIAISAVTAGFDTVAEAIKGAAG